jgi:hypothetical protein
MKSFAACFTLLFFLFAAPALFAQDDPAYTDLIYLKNGSMFKTRIIDYRQGDTITVEIAGGHILKFAESEIEKIRQVADAPQETVVIREQRKRTPRDAYAVEGWYGFASSAFSGQSDGIWGASASIVNFDAGAGYQFSPWLGLGLGAGYNLYNADTGESVAPVFAECRLYPFKKNLGPYLHLIGGYGFALKNESFGIEEARGGLLVHPAVGWRVLLGEKFFLTFDLGARFQSAEFTHNDLGWWLPGRSVRDVTYRRTTLRIGFQFW